jgi:hypothetical protein
MAVVLCFILQRELFLPPGLSIIVGDEYATGIGACKDRAIQAGLQAAYKWGHKLSV